jgi:hypothetical protein
VAAPTLLEGSGESGGVDADFRDLLRGLRELHEKPPGPTAGLIDPRSEWDKALEGCFSGDVGLHLKVRIVAQLPGVNEAEFCIDLQRLALSPGLATGHYAVPSIRDLKLGGEGDCPDWLDRPVLVSRVDFPEKHKRLPGDPCHGGKAGTDAPLRYLLGSRPAISSEGRR